MTMLGKLPIPSPTGSGAALTIAKTYGAKLSIPSPPGKGDRPQAVDEGRYGVKHCRNNGSRGRNVSTNSPTVSRAFQVAPLPSSVRAAPCQLPQRGSFCTGLWGGEFIDTPQESSQYLPQRGRGTARRRWMRGGTALNIVGTMGAEVETFLRIRPLFFECFRSPRPSSVRAAPCQLPRGEAFVPGFGVAGLSFQNSYFEIHFFLDFLQNILTNASEILGHIPVAVAQNCKAQLP